MVLVLVASCVRLEELVSSILSFHFFNHDTHLRGSATPKTKSTWFKQQQQQPRKSNNNILSDCRLWRWQFVYLIFKLSHVVVNYGRILFFIFIWKGYSVAAERRLIDYLFGSIQEPKYRPGVRPKRNSRLSVDVSVQLSLLSINSLVCWGFYFDQLGNFALAFRMTKIKNCPQLVT